MWTVCEVGRGDPQRQRQVPAQPDELLDGVFLAQHPFRAQHADHDGRCLLRREHPELQPVRAVAGDQTGQAVPARHDRQAARPARHQRSHVGGARRVVHDDQDALVGRDRPEHADHRVLLQRDVLTGHAERPDRERERLIRGDRRPGRVPAQVDVHLAVGEPARHLVRPLHGQRRLADAGNPAHDRQPAAALEQRGQLLQRLGAPGEARHDRGQLSRHRDRNADRFSLHPAPGGEPRRHLVVGHAERPQQAAQHLHGRRGLPARAQRVRQGAAREPGQLLQLPQRRVAGPHLQRTQRGDELIERVHVVRSRAGHVSSLMIGPPCGPRAAASTSGWL